MAGTRRLKNTRLHPLEREPTADRSLAAQEPYRRLMLGCVLRAMKDIRNPAIATPDTGGEFGASFDAMAWLLEVGPAWAAEAGVELDRECLFGWLADGAQISGNLK